MIITVVVVATEQFITRPIEGKLGGKRVRKDRWRLTNNHNNVQ